MLMSCKTPTDKAINIVDYVIDSLRDCYIEWSIGNRYGLKIDIFPVKDSGEVEPAGFSYRIIWDDIAECEGDIKALWNNDLDYLIVNALQQYNFE